MNADSQASVFCRTCATNQALIVAITANWEPDQDDAQDIVRRSDDEDGGQDLDYMRWRERLEYRYPPVCSDCLPRVEQKLHSADKQARALIWNDLMRERQRRGASSRSDTGNDQNRAGKARVSLKSRKMPMQSTVRATSKHAAPPPDLSSLSLDADQPLLSFADHVADAAEGSDIDDSMDWAPTPHTSATTRQRNEGGVLLGPQRFFEPLRHTGLEDMLADKLGLNVAEPVVHTSDGDTVMASAASQDRQEHLRKRRQTFFTWLSALLVLSFAYIISHQVHFAVSDHLANLPTRLQRWWQHARRYRQKSDQGGIWASLRHERRDDGVA